MARSELTTDPEHIEQWAYDHDVVPVRRGGQIELLPRDEVGDTQERLDWETFHQEIADGDRVVVRHEDPEGPTVFEVVEHDSALERMETEEEHDREEVRERLLEGETITGTISETTVVSATIVEEATLESEVVDRSVVDRRVVDVELRDRRCESCEIVGPAEDVDYAGGGTLDARIGYDRDRFLTDDVDGTADEITTEDGYPYDLRAEVAEEWTVTLEERERYTVETRVTDVDVSELDTVDSQEIETAIDLESVHRRLLEDERFGVTVEEGQTVGADTHHIESEFTEDDVIMTYLTTERVIEREVDERRQLTAEVASGKLLSRTAAGETVRETRVSERDSEAAAGAVGESAEMAETEAETGPEGYRLRPDESDVGKKVFAGEDTEVGMVSAVENRIAYVDPHPGITDRIAAKLGWGGIDDEDFPVDEHRIERITADAVHLVDDYDEESVLTETEMTDEERTR